jgi:hypothetical protein
MLTGAQFLEMQPEFSTAPTALLNATVAQAAARTDATVFGALTDEAHRWLIADILACSPFGREAQLAPKPGEQSMYGVKRGELVALVAAGYGSLGP